MAQGHKDTVASHRKGKTIAALGGPGLFEPVDHLIDLGILAMGGHARAQRARNFAQGAARPLNAMLAPPHLKHFLLGLIGGPTAHTFGEGRRGDASFKAQGQL